MNSLIKKHASVLAAVALVVFGVIALTNNPNAVGLEKSQTLSHADAGETQIPWVIETDELVENPGLMKPARKCLCKYYGKIKRAKKCATQSPTKNKCRCKMAGEKMIQAPSSSPSCTPMGHPSASPSQSPSQTPSRMPSLVPSKHPSVMPTTPSQTTTPSTPNASPSQDPSNPSLLPSVQATSNNLSISPSGNPSANPSTSSPTTPPSSQLTKMPSVLPTNNPSRHLPLSPSNVPSNNLSTSASSMTRTLTNPSSSPSGSPSSPSAGHSKQPTFKATMNPSQNAWTNQSTSLTPTMNPSTLASLSSCSSPSVRPPMIPSPTNGSIQNHTTTFAPTGQQSKTSPTTTSSLVSQGNFSIQVRNRALELFDCIARPLSTAEMIFVRNEMYVTNKNKMNRVLFPMGGTIKAWKGCTLASQKVTKGEGLRFYMSEQLYAPLGTSYGDNYGQTCVDAQYVYDSLNQMNTFDSVPYAQSYQVKDSFGAVSTFFSSFPRTASHPNSPPFMINDSVFAFPIIPSAHTFVPAYANQIDTCTVFGNKSVEFHQQIFNMSLKPGNFCRAPKAVFDRSMLKIRVRMQCNDKCNQTIFKRLNQYWFFTISLFLFGIGAVSLWNSFHCGNDQIQVFVQTPDHGIFSIIINEDASFFDLLVAIKHKFAHYRLTIDLYRLQYGGKNITNSKSMKLQDIALGNGSTICCWLPLRGGGRIYFEPIMGTDTVHVRSKFFINCLYQTTLHSKMGSIFTLKLTRLSQPQSKAFALVSVNEQHWRVMRSRNVGEDPEIERMQKSVWNILHQAADTSLVAAEDDERIQNQRRARQEELAQMYDAQRKFRNTSWARRDSDSEEVIDGCDVKPEDDRDSDVDGGLDEQQWDQESGF